MKTLPRIGHVPKRRKKKEPTTQTLLHVEYLEWLVAEFGAEAVAEWNEPPISFLDWKRARELDAHEAA
ncbi:MAG: hypothetical protein ACYTGN_00355 [Planctomycetota bacterium]|jgi:hypothetical protein